MRMMIGEKRIRFLSASDLNRKETNVRPNMCPMVSTIVIVFLALHLSNSVVFAWGDEKPVDQRVLVEMLAFSSDGQYLAGAGTVGISVWKVRSGEMLWSRQDS